MPASPPVVYDEARKVWSTCDYPYWDFVNQSLGEVFLNKMRTLSPSHVLEYFVDSDVEKTAGEIYRESVTVARQLQQLGVQKGDVVVLYSQSNELTTPLIFGCTLMGAIFNCFELQLSTAHLDATLKLLSPVLILYEDAYSQDVAASLQRSPLPSLRHCLSIDATQTPNVESILFQPAATDAEMAGFQSVLIADPQHEIAGYVLTSGSTGPPKAVQMTHALLLHGLITWHCHTNTPARLSADTVLFSFSVLRWISQLDMLLMAVLFGAKRISARAAADGVYGRDIISKCGITNLFSVPTTFQDILEAVPADDTKTLSSLRCVQLGGETPSQALRDLAKRLIKNGRTYCCYGMTEMCGIIAHGEVINGGKLVTGLQLQLLDDAWQPVGPGVRGQLNVKAVVPFKGYLKLDNSKYYSADGYFLNGDYGYVDTAGVLHIEGRYQDLIRAKDVIIIPNNVEYIIKKLPEISSACMVGYRRSGSGDTAVLFVTLKSSVKSSHDEVRQKLWETLKMNLSDGECGLIGGIHILQMFPLTGCGKVDRAALSNQACAI